MIAKSRVAFGASVLAICLMCGAAAAQEPTDPDIEMLQARVGQFLGSISLGTTQAAYQQLLAGSRLLEQAEAVEALVEKTDLLTDRYGQYLEFEPVALRRVGSDLIVLKYLYKCADFPVVFYFTFYRTPRSESSAENPSWRAIIVRFDTELELLALAPDSA